MNLNYETLSSNDFQWIANYLLNNCILKSNNTMYRFIEIEFYLRNKNHYDTYTHCHKDQLLCNTFYFHKQWRSQTYKSGTFKGMDLVFGDEQTDTYFGILIRSMIELGINEQNFFYQKDVIIGPCNCVNKILKDYELQSINELTMNKSLNLFNNERNFILINYPFINEEIYYGPRIGLSYKYPNFQHQYYRFVIFPELMKREKKSLIPINYIFINQIQSN